MNKKLSIIVNITISLIIVALLFKFADLNFFVLIDQIKTTNLFWFSLCALAYLVQVFTNTYRWNLLTKLLGYPIKYLTALSWYFQGQFSNSFMPSNLGGDALRSYYLGKEKKDWLRAAGTVLVERVIGLLSMVMLIPLAMPLLYLTSKNELIPDYVIYAEWGLFLASVLAVLSYRLWSRIPFKPIDKLRFAVDEYTKCFKSMSKVFLWTFITHIFLVLGHIFAAKAAGISFSEVPFWYWFLVIPSSILASFIIPSVRGLGSKEAAYVFFLGLLGLSSEKALAVGFIIFASMLVSSLPGIIGILGRLESKLKAVSRA